MAVPYSIYHCYAVHRTQLTPFVNSYTLGNRGTDFINQWLFISLHLPLLRNLGRVYPLRHTITKLRGTIYLTYFINIVTGLTSSPFLYLFATSKSSTIVKCSFPLISFHTSIYTVFLFNPSFSICFLFMFTIPICQRYIFTKARQSFNEPS